MTEYPKQCEFCGLTRRNAGHRPCLDKSKVADDLKDKVDEKCPAAPIMWV